MTHELKHIIEVAYKSKHVKHVLATVVALDGSSYRKPGVQMLISEDGSLTGAVSGGCVEKEVQFQSQSVFSTQNPKVITYDGTYRLGCKGVLYLLLEPFSITAANYILIQHELKKRNSLLMTSYFEKDFKESNHFGSTITLSNQQILKFRDDFIPNEHLKQFTQTFSAISQLVIIGSEHDAVYLCKAASQLGWEVRIIGSPRAPKPIENFTGASQISYLDPQMPIDFTIDSQTAIVLMNHNYARDFHFLLELQNEKAFYIGILGSANRREKLMQDLLEHNAELDIDFMNLIYSPAGINIGAITPQEIAISILSEIIATKQNKEVPSLRHQMGTIHL